MFICIFIVQTYISQEFYDVATRQSQAAFTGHLTLSDCCYLHAMWCLHSIVIFSL